MEQIIDNKTHKFIPSSVVSFTKIHLNKLILKNDVFEKWEAIIPVNGEYILCNNNEKIKKSSNRTVKESYNDYVEFLCDKHNIENDRWVYNILDGETEKHMVIERDNKCVVIPSYTWDTKNIEKLHILCMPTDKGLRSIRELTKEHIELLEHMKKTTVCIIEEKYGVKEENIKMFFHYDPSTYHLHIHFVNILYKEMESSVEYSHDLDTVIFNLGLDGDYYKKINLRKRLIC